MTRSETLTSLVDNGDGTMTYTDEDGTVNTINTSVAVADGSIDITGDGIVDNDVTLQDIINSIDIIVDAEETVTTLVYDGLLEELTYTDEDGTATVIDIGTIIDGSETLTSLVDNGDGTMTYTDEDGTANTINTSVAVADGSIDITGDGIVDNDVTLQDIINSIDIIVDAEETVTTLVYNGLLEELTYTDEDGTATVIDIGTIIDGSETLTSLVDNGDGTMTYTDEDGTVNTINTSVAVANGSIDITGDGIVDNDVTLQDIINSIDIIVDAEETVTTLVYDGLLEELTYTDEDGTATVIDIGTIIDESETLTSLVDNGDGTMTYTDEDGTANTINTSVAVANGSIDITGDGIVDNDVTLQDIINSIDIIVDAEETVTTLVYDGLLEELTYTDEDGTATVIDIGTIIDGSETLTSLVDNGDGTMTYTDEDGTANTINTSVAVANGSIDITGDGIVDNDVTLQDIINSIDIIVDAEETVTTLVYDGLLEELTYTDEDGTATVIDMAAIIDQSETLTSLVDNGDGTMTYTDENGIANIIDTTVEVVDGTIDITGDGLGDDDVTLQDIVNNIGIIVDAEETVTTLVDNGNSTMTYTDENGSANIINMLAQTLYTVNGNLIGDRTVTQGANTLNFTSTADNAFTVDGTTFNVDADTDRVGIGTNAPSVELDVNGNARVRTIPLGTLGDVVMTADVNGNIRSRTAAQIVTDGGGITTDTNIANTNLALSGNRTVAQGANTLNFTSTADNAFTVDGTTFNIDANTNNVGIGTNGPTQALDVNGRARVRTLTGGAAADAVVTTDVSGNLRSRTAAQIVAAGGGNLGTTDQTLTTNRAVTTGGFDLNIDANTLVVDGSANNVGIGTTAPSVPLDVNGQARVRTLTAGAAADAVVTADGSGNLRSRTAAQIVAAGGGNLGTTDQTLTSNRAVTTGGFDLNVDANTLVVDGSLNRVGIGTAIPTVPLDVNGEARVRTITAGAAADVVVTANASGNLRSRTAAQIVAAGGGNLGTTNQTLTSNRAVTTGGFDLNVDANTLVVDGSLNRVGIGIAAPSVPLDVNGQARVRTLTGGVATDVVVTADGSGNLRSRTPLEIVNAAGGFPIDTYLGNTNQTLTGNRTVTTGAFDLNIDANTLVVDGSANNVGIGTAAPTVPLDVNGQARIRTIPNNDNDNSVPTELYNRVLTADPSGNVQSRAPILSDELNINFDTTGVGFTGGSVSLVDFISSYSYTTKCLNPGASDDVCISVGFRPLPNTDYTTNITIRAATGATLAQTAAVANAVSEPVVHNKTTNGFDIYMSSTPGFNQVINVSIVVIPWD